MQNIFIERIPYKPFEYPEYFTEGWLKAAQSFWLHTEIPMQRDVKDWKENLTESEKHLVGNILLGFAQTECAISDYWSSYVTRWFPKHEIKQMAIYFGAQETIHAAAYSYLNDTLGLTDYDGFLHEPAINDKFQYLMEVDNDINHIDLFQSAEDRYSIARSLAIFSAFAEGVSLYSSFAVLYSFSLRNLLPGISQQMKWSVRDEALHSSMGCALFRQLCLEYPEIKNYVKSDIQSAAKMMLKMELTFIDKMFEMGDLENLKKNDLKEFIKKRMFEKLNELGYNDIILTYDNDAANNLDWFYKLSAGVSHDDFFVMRPTNYSKANENEDWDDIFSS